MKTLLTGSGTICVWNLWNKYLKQGVLPMVECSLWKMTDSVWMAFSTPHYLFRAHSNVCGNSDSLKLHNKNCLRGQRAYSFFFLLLLLFSWHTSIFPVKISPHCVIFEAYLIWRAWDCTFHIYIYIDMYINHSYGKQQKMESSFKHFPWGSGACCRFGIRFGMQWAFEESELSMQNSVTRWMWRASRMQYLTLCSGEKEADIDGVKLIVLQLVKLKECETLRVMWTFKIPSFLFLWGVKTLCQKSVKLLDVLKEWNMKAVWFTDF